MKMPPTGFACPPFKYTTTVEIITKQHTSGPIGESTGGNTGEQRLKLTIAYNGARFKGWQKGNGRTVQDTLITALNRAMPNVSNIRVDGAGRTDAGVHALGQVASVVIPCEVDCLALLHGVNSYLPDDVVVHTVELADERFHARYHAVCRTYRYTIMDGPVGDPFLNGLAWRYPATLDTPAIVAAASVLTGEHDFATFTADKKRPNTVRKVLSINVSRRESHWQEAHRSVPQPLDIIITGDSFLWRQVRIMVGALVLAGTGKLTPDALYSVLSSRDRARAPGPAPAWGLTLLRVDY